jgi:two-component sensor histidine kinase
LRAASLRRRLGDNLHHLEGGVRRVATPLRPRQLSVADNGIGKPDGVFAQPKTGLGTGIVKALAQQLGAKVETLADPAGTTVSITHATFWTKQNRAA